MKIFRPTDIIKFGKNYGLTLAEIYQYQPSYIEWLILNVEDFKIDIEEFEHLPTPTTIGYKPKNFSEEKEDLDFTLENIFQIIEETDTTNFLADVEYIKNRIQEGAKIDEISTFHFPENIKKVNNNKY